MASGSKGGTGKSVVSAALSYSLARHFGSTLLADLGGGDSASIALGSVPKSLCLEDYLKGEAEPRDIFLESSFAPRLLIAPSRDPLTSGFYLEQLEEILKAAKADYVVLDFPPYVHGPLDNLLEQADEVLIVVTPARLVFERMRRWLESRTASLGESRLIGLLNMYFSTLRSWKRTLLSIMERVEVLSFDLALEFTYTRNIAEAMICCSKSTRREVLELATKLSK